MTEPDLPIGDTLVGVQYELLSWEGEPSREEAVDQVSMAVRLVWEGTAPMRVTWSSDVESEGLAFGDPGPADPSPEVRIVDVSSRWRSLMGDRLSVCSFSHAEPPADLPWAMNLHLASGRHLLIALGELLSEELVYIPDPLVVTDSREVARSYAPRAARGTACGDSPWDLTWLA